MENFVIHLSINLKTEVWRANKEGVYEGDRVRPKQVCSTLSRKFVWLHICASDSEICVFLTSSPWEFNVVQMSKVRKFSNNALSCKSSYLFSSYLLSNFLNEVWVIWVTLEKIVFIVPWSEWLLNKLNTSKCLSCINY